MSSQLWPYLDPETDPDLGFSLHRQQLCGTGGGSGGGGGGRGVPNLVTPRHVILDTNQDVNPNVCASLPRSATWVGTHPGLS